MSQKTDVYANRLVSNLIEDEDPVSAKSARAYLRALQLSIPDVLSKYGFRSADEVASRSTFKRFDLDVQFPTPLRAYNQTVPGAPVIVVWYPSTNHFVLTVWLIGTARVTKRNRITYDDLEAAEMLDRTLRTTLHIMQKTRPPNFTVYELRDRLLRYVHLR
jgi:hypothetical protein